MPVADARRNKLAHPRLPETSKARTAREVRSRTVDTAFLMGLLDTPWRRRRKCVVQHIADLASRRRCGCGHPAPLHRRCDSFCGGAKYSILYPAFTGALPMGPASNGCFLTRRALGAGPAASNPFSHHRDGRLVGGRRRAGPLGRGPRSWGGIAHLPRAVPAGAAAEAQKGRADRSRRLDGDGTARQRGTHAQLWEAGAEQVDAWVTLVLTQAGGERRWVSGPQTLDPPPKLPCDRPIVEASQSTPLTPHTTAAGRGP
jgi:hypothetical protein